MSGESPKQPTVSSCDASPPREAHNYICECCNYSTNIKFNYETHLSSNKHKKRENNIPTIYKCDICGIEYKLRQSLYKHKKTCTGNNNLTSRQPTIAVTSNTLDASDSRGSSVPKTFTITNKSLE